MKEGENKKHNRKAFVPLSLMLIPIACLIHRPILFSFAVRDNRAAAKQHKFYIQHLFFGADALRKPRGRVSSRQMLFSCIECSFFIQPKLSGSRSIKRRKVRKTKTNENRLRVFSLSEQKAPYDGEHGENRTG